MNVTNKSVMVKSSAVLSDAVMHFFMRGVLNTIVVLVNCYVIREQRNKVLYKQLPVKQS